MRENKKWDAVFATASWVIVVALVVAVVSLLIQDPSGAGPVSRLLGVTAAKWFYIALYSAEALVLAYSKLWRRKELRKKALVAVYLTGLFTSILTLSIVGITPKIIDNVVLAVVAGGCWLYWKFKTEYIDPRAFDHSVMTMRDDLPPP